MKKLFVILAALMPLLLVSCNAVTRQDAAGRSVREDGPAAATQADVTLRTQLEVLVEPNVYITRIERRGAWALAAVVETPPNEEAAPSQYYTARTFRRSDAGEWEQVPADSAAWGEQRTLAVDGLKIEYRTFDEPYVRAIAPRIELFLPKMAADFGLGLPPGEVYTLRVKPIAEAGEPQFSDDSSVLTVPSPLSPGFPLGTAQSPEEFLLGYTTDMLAHALLNRAFGAGAKEPSRLALAHSAVQWAVHEAVGRDFPKSYVLQIGETLTPLASLLDPTQFNVDGSRTAERDWFLRFAIAKYGREIVPPYLHAVFASNNAEDLVRQTFDQDIAEVEGQWRQWLEHRLRIERP
jgi:hypothetical protein